MTKKTIIATAFTFFLMASNANAAYVCQHGKCFDVDACETYDNGQVGWSEDGKISFSSNRVSCHSLSGPNAEVNKDVKEKLTGENIKYRVKHKALIEDKSKAIDTKLSSTKVKK